jgi:hypothetical protein
MSHGRIAISPFSKILFLTRKQGTSSVSRPSIGVAFPRYRNLPSLQDHSIIPLWSCPHPLLCLQRPSVPSPILHFHTPSFHLTPTRPSDPRPIRCIQSNPYPPRNSSHLIHPPSSLPPPTFPTLSMPTLTTACRSLLSISSVHLWMSPSMHESPVTRPALYAAGVVPTPCFVR